jgi:hypothetical protein
MTLGSRLAAGAGDEQCQIVPGGFVGPGRQALVDAPQDGAELSVVDTDDDD